MMEVLYRAFYWQFNEDLLWYEEYPVIKHTQHGVWINYHEKRKFVLMNARKRFAWPTKEEAKISYIARTIKHLAHLRARADRVEEELNAVLGLKEKPQGLLSFLG